VFCPSVLSSFGLPLPPTCLLLTVSEARSYFSSTIRISHSIRRGVSHIIRSQLSPAVHCLEHTKQRAVCTSWKHHWEMCCSIWRWHVSQKLIVSEHALYYIFNLICTVHRPGDDPRKEFEECGNARGSNVRYYPTWKHSPPKERNEQSCYNAYN
jgi:hypothetical protein